MALFVIDGVDMPAPHKVVTKKIDISKDPKRDSQGIMLIERVAQKISLEIKYNYLTNSQAITLFGALQPVYVEVIYPNPITGTTASSTFYTSDKEIELLDYQNDTPRYGSCTFAFIEK